VALSNHTVRQPKSPQQHPPPQNGGVARTSGSEYIWQGGAATLNRTSPALKPTLTLKTAVAGLKMAHLPKIALAFEHLHHFDRP
jgi:hypothetical protein